jgi:hypothetical protein
MATGRHSDGTKFLQTVNQEDGLVEYKLIDQDPSKELSVWQYEANGMTFTIVDGRDMAYTAAHKRHVSIAMTMKDQAGNTLFEGLVAYGHHIQQKSN